MKASKKALSLGRRMILIAIAAIVGTLAVAPTTASAAGDAVHTSSSSTYTALPSKGVVKVAVTLKVTNRIANSVSSKSCEREVWDEWSGTYVSVPTTCTTTTRFYVNQEYLVVENGATNLKITSMGGAVKRSKMKESTDDFTVYKLTFPQTFNGQTRTIKATYTIKSGKPRTEAAVKVNGGYVNFGAITQPTDVASMKVVVPASFETSTWGGKVKESTKSGKRTYASAGVKDPAKFFVGVHGTDAKGFDEAVATSASGREIHIQAWPGDKAWKSAVQAGVVGSISDLEAVIGRPVTGTGPIIVREVARGELGDAIAGMYDDDSRIASVSEDFDQAGLVAHELAHAWFNTEMFDTKWLWEGHAEWAEGAVDPTAPSCVAPAPGESIDFSAWPTADPRSTAEQRESLGAHYDAACAVVTTVAARVGADRMREVIDVLATSDGAYPGTTDAKVDAPNDWKQWLDAIDERGSTTTADASETVSDQLVRYGVTSESTLRERTTARSTLRDLRGLAGATWTIPGAVYRPMSSWDFAAADRAMDTTTAIITDVTATAAALPGVAVGSSQVRGDLEAADTAMELDAARDLAADQRSTAERLASTIDRAANPNPIEAIGLIGTDLGAASQTATDHIAALELAEARSSTETMDAAMSDATPAGLIRLAIVTVLVLAVSAVLIWRRRRGEGATTSHDLDRSVAGEPVGSYAQTSADDGANA